MIVLDNITDTLEIILAGAITATNPDYYVSYVDVTTTTYVPGDANGATNGVTQVTMVAAPAGSTQRQIKFISVFNRDSANVTITIRLDDTSNERTLWRGILAPNEMVQYADGEGWNVLNSSGVKKTLLNGGVTALVANGGSATGPLIYLRGVPGVSFGVNGQTITYGETPLNVFHPDDGMDDVGGGAAVTASSGGANLSFQWFNIQHPIQPNLLQYTAGIAQAQSREGTVTAYAGIYTENAGTMSLASSASQSFSWTSGNTTINTSRSDSYVLISNPRPWMMTLNTWLVTPGSYYLGMFWSAAGQAGSLPAVTVYFKSNRLIEYGALSNSTASSKSYWGGDGLYSVATGALPNYISKSDLWQVNHTGALRQPLFKLYATSGSQSYLQQPV